MSRVDVTLLHLEDVVDHAASRDHQGAQHFFEDGIDLALKVVKSPKLLNIEVVNHPFQLLVHKLGTLKARSQQSFYKVRFPDSTLRI